MNYCLRCCYPENTRPAIVFDECGVCSGCRVVESFPAIDWRERGEQFKGILAEFSAKARANGALFDCIIPVSGGKDSHYQAHIIKNVLGYRPLLVSYNHGFNTSRGIRNLTNMIKKFGCHLLRFTSSAESAKKISRYMLKKVGDITWHYHAGIMTFPIQAAAMYKISLIIWGEHGYADLVGMHDQDDLRDYYFHGRNDWLFDLPKHVNYLAFACKLSF